MLLYCLVFKQHPDGVVTDGKFRQSQMLHTLENATVVRSSIYHKVEMKHLTDNSKRQSLSSVDNRSDNLSSSDIAIGNGSSATETVLVIRS
jgi:hypothetical protein